MNYGVLGHSLNSNITYKLLCRWLVFPMILIGFDQCFNLIEIIVHITSVNNTHFQQIEIRKTRKSCFLFHELFFSHSTSLLNGFYKISQKVIKASLFTGRLMPKLKMVYRLWAPRIWAPKLIK